MYQAEAIRGLDVGDRSIGVESDDMHYHESAHEATGGY